MCFHYLLIIRMSITRFCWTKKVSGDSCSCVNSRIYFPKFSFQHCHLVSSSVIHQVSGYSFMEELLSSWTGRSIFSALERYLWNFVKWNKENFKIICNIQFCTCRLVCMYVWKLYMCMHENREKLSPNYWRYLWGVVYGRIFVTSLFLSVLLQFS